MLRSTIEKIVGANVVDGGCPPNVSAEQCNTSDSCSECVAAWLGSLEPVTEDVPASEEGEEESRK
jgi:hypothetical protein